MLQARWEHILEDNDPNDSGEGRIPPIRMPEIIYGVGSLGIFPAPPFSFFFWLQHFSSEIYP